MPLTRISAADRPPAVLADADVVVCVPLYGAHDLFVRCLRSVLEHTSIEVPVLIADDAGPDPASETWSAEILERGALQHQVVWARQPGNVGFVGNCNAAFALCGSADVVLVNSDVEVAEGWLEGLRDAAADDAVATVTALTNHGTIVSVPYRNNPQADLPGGVTFQQAAARVRKASRRVRPEIPTAIGHCMLIKRPALDLVGGFDQAFSPAYGEEVDFSQRCVLYGLRHVVADDVLVLHHGRGSMGIEGARSPLQDAHELILRSRYPYYAAAVAAVERADGPLGRAIMTAGQALLGTSVTIDGRCLTRTMTGTQVHTLEVISALWRTGHVRLRVVVPMDLGDVAREALARMPDVTQISEQQARDGVHRDDVAHRPFQVNGPEDVQFLLELGQRIVVTHHDLIAYRNPGYFSGAREWQRYRRLTRETMALADRVLFVSEHGAREAITEGLISKTHASVAPNGIDHHFESHVRAPVRPEGAPELDGRPFLLVLGTDFRHKNRLFAMRVFEQLRERHGWEGRLVLAGHRVAHGSSAGDEDAWLALRPEVAGAVVRLSAVDESGKDWLLEHAAALVYPTTYEGFGLPPFEAAAADRPCFFASVSALAEVLDGTTATVVPWDPVRTADRAIEVLNDPQRAASMAAEVRAAGERYSWDSAAHHLLAAYEQTLQAPPRTARVVAGTELTMHERYWGLRNDIGPAGLALVDPARPLLTVPMQRSLVAIARRRVLRVPLVAVLGLMQVLVRRGRPTPDAGADGSGGALPVAEEQ